MDVQTPRGYELVPSSVNGTPHRKARQKDALSVSSTHSVVDQAASAAIYACSSLLVIIINKIVLTSYKFPCSHVLALSQFAATSVILWTLKMLGRIQINFLTRDALSAVAPLTVLFCLNVVAGLGGTQRVNLPMFTVLRRFSILMTMILEQHLLGDVPSARVRLSVGLMLGGAVVAAVYDLAFDLTGYAYILGNDVFTAGYGVAMKYALSSGRVNKMSLLFYNSLFSLFFMAGLTVWVNPLTIPQVAAFEGWKNNGFLLAFGVASVMGCVLQYSIFLCTSVNSALTTTVVGCLKNVLTAYLGLLVGGDYRFAWANFLGMNISILGSIVYSHAKYLENR